MIKKYCLDCGISVKYGRRCYRCANLGKNNPMYGKRFKRPGTSVGVLNSMYGKHHSKETKLKMRDKKFGKPLTQQHIENIRKGHIGHKHSDMVKQKIGKANKGTKHTIETKLKMSKNHANVYGNKNPNWCGGKSFEPYSESFNKILKNKIRIRDMFQCMLCKDAAPKQLQVHHIDYNKLNDDDSNLILLCTKCHSKTNFNRKLWPQKLYKLIQGGYNESIRT